MTYIVQSYAAAGYGDQPRTRHHTSLADARADVRARLGVDRLHPSRRWNPPILNEDPGIAIEGWSAYPPSHPRADQCGGAVIYREDVA